MTLNLKNVKETMEFLYKVDRKSYYELYKAIRTLYNFGLVGEYFFNSMVKKDHELFHTVA